MMIKLALGILLMLSLSGCSSLSQGHVMLSTANKLGVSGRLLENAPDSYQSSYAANSQVQVFISNMVEKDHYNKKTLELAFSLIQPRENVIKKSNNQPEVMTPFYEYRKRFVSKKRIREGVAFAKKNRYWLDKAEREYGVDWRIIVSLICVETYYGQITGSKDIFTSLTTLAFDYPRRQKFFQSELRAYLLLARKEGWKIGNTKGSYSGAMGMVQFMPTNYQKLAVDFDGDGHIDLWHSDADAIGSVANYLHHHGWQRGQPSVVLAQVKNVERVSDLVNFKLKPIKNTQKWAALGVVKKGPDLAKKMGLVSLQTAVNTKTYWLAYENFFTIMDYNPSRRYAMSVVELAKSIDRNETP